MINKFVTTFGLENVWYMITLYINVYITLSITCNDNSKKMKTYSLLCLIFAIILQVLKSTINLPLLFVMIDMIYLFLLSILYMVSNKRKITKNNIISYWFYMLLLNVLQLCSICIRNVSIQNQLQFDNSFVIGVILNLDYLIVLVILYKLYFMRGGVNLWDLVVSYGSQKLTSLKKLLKDSHVKSQNKVKLTKEEKLTYMIYMPLYILWNMFTMLVIIIIAILNNAMIETIFITISFWINKRVFGQPFHFKSVSICFCFSSIVYYVLTRITFSIQTSILIPIILGVTLSYVTSIFMKKNYKLYKGMTIVLFDETIKQVTDDELIIKMCKEYYCDRYNDIKIASINNYSVDSVRKKRQKVNKDLRNLEK